MAAASAIVPIGHVTVVHMRSLDLVYQSTRPLSERPLSDVDDHSTVLQDAALLAEPFQPFDSCLDGSDYTPCGDKD